MRSRSCRAEAELVVEANAPEVAFVAVSVRADGLVLPARRSSFCNLRGARKRRSVFVDGVVARVFQYKRRFGSIEVADVFPSLGS